MLGGSNVVNDRGLGVLQQILGLFGEEISPLVIGAYWISCKPIYL